MQVLTHFSWATFPINTSPPSFKASFAPSMLGSGHDMFVRQEMQAGSPVFGASDDRNMQSLNSGTSSLKPTQQEKPPTDTMGRRSGKQASREFRKRKKEAKSSLEARAAELEQELPRLQEEKARLTSENEGLNAVIKALLQKIRSESDPMKQSELIIEFNNCANKAGQKSKPQ